MASDYIARHITQIDSGTCRKTNCWAAVGAYLVDSGTRGKKRPTPMEFRAAAGRLKGCPPGGLGDIILGCKRFGVKATLLLDVPRTQMRRRLSSNKSNKVYAIPFDWEVWPDEKKCAGDYDGYHSDAIIPGINKKKLIRSMDPLCTRIRWVKRSDIIDAAIEYNNEHYGQRRDTVDMVYVTVPKAR
ncbi:MAG TPA: hypothetical protein VMW94_07110 [Actinomycetes bacterium]|nr:hypothetical protein [Actinomycetes bacterium]